MAKVSFFVIGTVLSLLTLVPLPTNAIGPWALIAGGKEIADMAMGAYNAMEELYKQKNPPAEQESLQLINNIFSDLTYLKNDLKNWRHDVLTSKVATKVDYLVSLIEIVDDQYEQYYQYKTNNTIIYNGTVVKAVPERIETFAKLVTSQDPGGFPQILSKIHKEFTRKNQFGSHSLLSVLATNETEPFRCIRVQSVQQIIIELYRSIIDADMKGLVVQLFAFDQLEKFENKAPGYYYHPKLEAQHKLANRADRTLFEFKKYVGMASREVWRCDPAVHQKDVTFTNIQEAFQTYAFYEKDHNDGCKKECKEFNHLYKNEQPKCVSGFCQKLPERKRCHGKLMNCQKIHKTQKYCFAPDSSDRRYEWMITGEKTAYGPYDPRCSDIVDVSEVQGLSVVGGYMATTIKSDCDTCVCTCISEKQDVLRHISLESVFSDVLSNKVVTGIRFVKYDNIISLQIQEGTLKSNGSIDQDSVGWRKDFFDPSEHEVYTVSTEQNTVFLDDIVTPSTKIDPKYPHTERYVIAVQLQKVDKNLRLQVSFAEFDFDTGKFLSKDRTAKFYDNNKNNRKPLLLANSAEPTRTYQNYLDSSDRQYVEFQLSGLKEDFGQSIVPFIDLQSVETKPALPLKGVGLIHKGTQGFGGFLGFKLIQADSSHNL